jgi:hypothetical protein
MQHYLKVAAICVVTMAIVARIPAARAVVLGS